MGNKINSNFYCHFSPKQLDFDVFTKYFRQPHCIVSCKTTKNHELKLLEPVLYLHLEIFKCMCVYIYGYIYVCTYVFNQVCLQ